MFHRHSASRSFAVTAAPPIQFPVKASNLPSPSRGLVFRHQNLQGLLPVTFVRRALFAPFTSDSRSSPPGRRAWFTDRLTLRLPPWLSGSSKDHPLDTSLPVALNCYATACTERLALCSGLLLADRKSPLRTSRFDHALRQFPGQVFGPSSSTF